MKFKAHEELRVHSTNGDWDGELVEVVGVSSAYLSQFIWIVRSVCGKTDQYGFDIVTLPECCLERV